MSLKPLLKH